MEIIEKEIAGIVETLRDTVLGEFPSEGDSNVGEHERYDVG